MFKNNAIKNIQNKKLEKKQQINVLLLRNRFLGEWVASILGLNKLEVNIYIKNLKNIDKDNTNYKKIINKIALDFKKNNIKISSTEIGYKFKEFQMKANVIVENQFKLDKNWNEIKSR